MIKSNSTSSDLSVLSEPDLYDEVQRQQQTEPIESYASVLRKGISGKNVWQPTDNDAATGVGEAGDHNKTNRENSPLPQQLIHQPSLSQLNQPSSATASSSEPTIQSTHLHPPNLSTTSGMSMIPVPVLSKTKPHLSSDSTTKTPSTYLNTSKRKPGNKAHVVDPSAIREQILSKRAVSKWKEYIRLNRAQNHASRTLSRKVLLAWKSSTVLSWRSAVRAEVHDKFRLSSKAWRAWRSFVYIARIEKEEDAKVEAMGMFPRRNQ
jgi:hypothetical protein